MKAVPMVAILLVILCSLALAVAQQQNDAPFKHPKAVQSWNRFKFRENKAKEAYEREVAAAKAEYQAGLREAASLAAKAGDAGDVKAISEALEGDTADIKADPFRRKWIRLIDGSTMVFTFGRDGSLTASGRTAWRTWSPAPNGVSFNDGDEQLHFVSTQSLVGIDRNGKQIIMWPID